MSGLTHIDDEGAARMVDVSGKPDTERMARAEAVVVVGPVVMEALQSDKVPKGDVIAAARIAGIQAAKQTSSLIPLCHPLPISSVEVDLSRDPEAAEVTIVACCRTTGKTGVEMEALTAASVAALTVYDMCKGIDKGMTIRHVRLLEKTGGKSGSWASTEKDDA